MIHPLFADTGYYLGLINPRDALHSLAIEQSRSQARPIVTTAWVVQELADGLCAPKLRGTFLRVFEAIQKDEGATIVEFDANLWREGLTLYASRPDKAWSLTDCISFVVMTDRGLSEALTGDHHFEQAGFRALLRSR
jgi:uncharacterized protein